MGLELDRFATHYNFQLERFNYRYACPGSEAVDSFTVDWVGENNWWCPPPCLVARVIGHARPGELFLAVSPLLAPVMPGWIQFCTICVRYGIITPVS